jgi:hypothetical protein
MATTAVDIHGQGIALQSYQDKVQELTDVIVRHLARLGRIALRLLATSLTPRMRFRTLSCQPSHTRISSEDNVAHGHRDQCPSREIASTFTASANFFRRNPRRRNLLLAEMLPDHQPNPEEVCCRRELAERLADTTTQLSPTWRRTFQLRYVDGLSIGETAPLLECPAVQ